MAVQDRQMAIRAFHPILYVADPNFKRDFFRHFGFETVYEGDEFPGFLAVECGSVCFGLSGNKELPETTAYDCVRWQLLVDNVDEIVSVCAAAALPCEVIIGEGGTTSFTYSKDYLAQRGSRSGSRVPTNSASPSAGWRLRGLPL